MTHRLAVRLDSLGDLLVTGPALRALRASCDRLTLLCGCRGEAAAALLPGVDEVWSWHCPWIDAAPGPVDADRIAALVARLRNAAIDEAVIFTSFHQSSLPTALLLKSAGIPRVGAVSHDHAGSLLDVRLRPAGPIPEPEAQLRTALACGGQLPPGDDGRLQVRLSPSPTGIGPAPYVVVHPGADAPARTWPPHRFVEAVAALGAHGYSVLVTGGRRERALTATVAAASERAIDLGGRTDLAGLARLLREATAVVVGNTGPAHLAAAVGTPVVSLFAPTVPASVWAPYGVPNVLLGDQQEPCRHTRAVRCPVPGHPCLTSVTADDVVGAVQEIGRDTHPDAAVVGVAKQGASR